MTFLAPFFLLATLAAAIPVILHMFNRQKAKELPFSTLRFLRISVQKTRRRRRIQDLFLMFVRAAVLALIGLGLAKPTMTSFGALLGGGNASAIAILLDNSASMGVIDQNRARFETALGAARQILGQVRDGDQVGLFLTNGPTEGPFKEAGKLHRTQDLVEQMLNQAAVSYERADLGVQVQQARLALAAADAPNKQIYVITDQQKLSWDGLKKEESAAEEEQALSDLEKTARKIPVILVNCNRQPQPNAAVQGVELEAAIPVVGMPVKATVEVFNASGFEDKRLVELYLDDAKEAVSSELKMAQGRADLPLSVHLQARRVAPRRGPPRGRRRLEVRRPPVFHHGGRPGNPHRHRRSAKA